MFRASGISNAFDPDPVEFLHNCKYPFVRIPAFFLTNSSRPVPMPLLFDATNVPDAHVTKDKVPDLSLTRPHGHHPGDGTVAMPAANCETQQRIGTVGPCGTAGPKSPDICISASYRCPRQIAHSARNGYLRINDGKVDGPKTKSTQYRSSQHHAPGHGAQGRTANGCPIGHVSR